MSGPKTRIHVTLPDELVDTIDELVGPRKRSQYIADAAKEMARRDRLLKAVDEGAGILDSKDYPHWSTSEKVTQWVRELRDTPSIRRDPIERVLTGLKRSDQLAKRKSGGRSGTKKAKPRTAARSR